VDNEVIYMDGARSLLRSTRPGELTD